MVTIYDVAKRAGVSPATVSRVMNGRTVRPHLEERVLEAAAQLAFVPNRTARRLRQRASQVIALIVPTIENPFFTSLARGVEDVARAAGFSTIVCNSDADLTKEHEYIDVVLAEDIAGILLAPASTESSVAAIRERGRPVVAVDRPIRTEAVDCVVLDNASAARDATLALRREGYSRIAIITGPDDVVTAQDRVTGWREIVAEHQPDADGTAYVRHTNFRVDGGREMMIDLLDLDDPPDAVVAANNLVGVGALQVLAERGIDPNDLGVAVIGDLPFTTMAPRAVPIVRLPTRHMGMKAAHMLLDRIGGADDPVSTVVLRGELQAAL